VPRFETLEDVLRAGIAIVDVVVQDEFTHDVIARDPRGGYLVFDTT
jgi:hypothetical protein